MLHSLQHDANVDIEHYPEVDKNYPFDKGAQLTLGDLHGNALKLLYTLIRHGVVTNISREDYIAFNRLYKKTADEINAADIKWFKALLRKTKVNSEGTLRLIGDELADRGSNDYFTLSILAKLYNRTNVEIIVSNHSIEFIRAYEKAKKYISELLGFGGQATSMQNLQQLIDKKLISRAEVDAVVKNQYLPNVKLLSYTLDEANGRIAIFSHAPVGMECLQAIAEKLGVEFKDNSMNDLAQTIENINKVFNEKYVKTNKIHTLFDSETGFRDPSNADPKTAPFTHLIWNRNHDVNRPVDYKGYKIKWIHGHDARPTNILHKVYNLDNQLGKGVGHNAGAYNVHYTHEKQLGAPKVFADFEDAEPVDAPESVASRALDVVKNGFANFKDTLFAPSKHPIISGAIAGTVAVVASFALALTPFSIIVSGVLSALTVVTTLRAKNNLAESALQNYRATPLRAPAARRAYQEGIEAAQGWFPYAKSNLKVSAWKEPRAFAAGMESELRKPRI